MECFFVVDKDGTEWIWQVQPKREEDYWYNWYGNKMLLPYGAIEKITGKKMNWRDKPFRYEFNKL